ncbi:MAG TPA: deoxynucleoside kinase [Clostridia bacterium]|nr:deoxynucleoside kinase [Clostridia bacterium]
MVKPKRSGRYVCIEGLDGSGKTTLFKRLADRLTRDHVEFSTVSPTKTYDANNFIERAFRNISFLNQNRTARAFLYAHRSNQAADSTDWTKPLILGDRSLITSYVTRWGRSKMKNFLTTCMVNIMERKIFPPDHVIYLDVSKDILIERLNSRGRPRDIDETDLRSEQMKEAYFHLKNTCEIRRIAGIKWHIICGDGELDSIEDEAYKILTSIYNKREEVI